MYMYLTNKTLINTYWIINNQTSLHGKNEKVIWKHVVKFIVLGGALKANLEASLHGKNQNPM